MRITIACCLVLAIGQVVLTLPVVAQERPRVFIAARGTINTHTEGAVSGNWWFAVGTADRVVDAHDETTETAKDMLRDCPGVQVTFDRDSADYLAALNRESKAKKGLLNNTSQMLVINRAGDLIMANDTVTVRGAAKAACRAILADFQQHGRLDIAPRFALPKAPSPVVVEPATAAPAPPAPTLVIADQPQQSLGDIARKYREKKAQDQKRPPQPPN